MSALFLVSGKLTAAPVTRPTKNGAYVTFLKLKVANGTALEWWDGATFSGAAREELAGLGEGDAVSAVGVLRVETFELNGEKRTSLKLTADRVLGLRRKLKEAEPKIEKSARAAPAKAAGWVPERARDDRAVR